MGTRIVGTRGGPRGGGGGVGRKVGRKWKVVGQVRERDVKKREGEEETWKDLV